MSALAEDFEPEGATPPEPAKKPTGRRPSGRFNPNINWALGESLFVHGEDDESGVPIFPSYREIGKRIGTSKENVQQRARRYDWPGLRSAALEAKGIILAPPPASGPSPNPRARPRRTAEQVLLDYVALFDDQLRAKKVRADSVGDLDKAVRLLAFVRGEADSRRVTHTHVSLEVMQQRYERSRRQVIDATGEDVTGVLSHGGDGGLEGEEAYDLIADATPRKLPPARSGWAAAAARVATSEE